MGVFIGITVAGFITYLIVRAYKKQKAFDKALNEKLEAIYAKLSPEEVKTIKLAMKNEVKKNSNWRIKEDELIENPAFNNLSCNLFHIEKK